MLYLQTDDKYYYENLDDLKKKHKLNSIIVYPTIEDIKEAVVSKEKIGFISPNKPNKEIAKILIVKRLKAHSGLLTQQEKDYSISEAESIMNKLGLRTIKSILTFDDMGGFDKFKDWSKKTDKVIEKGGRIKPIFLLGMPGTGKSRLVEAYAGEKDIPMVELNLSLIMESDYPLEMLNDIFTYLTDTNIKCILRIDEIEQMLTIPSLVGEMLTILSDLNTPSGYQLNGILFATANNISDVIVKSPQFFRHGRWNEKFFVGFPNREDTIDIMKYYATKYKIDLESLGEEMNVLRNIYADIETSYKKKNLVFTDDRCIYVPSEIDYLFYKLSQYDKVDFAIIKDEIQSVLPQQITATEGIRKMYTEAKKLSFIEL